MNKYALLVGVEDYRDQMISRPNFARADAMALAERLSDRCGFGSVRMLTDDNGTDEPLLVNIVTALRDTSAELRQDDLFLFFFAGHGVEKDGHGYLLARDSLQAFPEHGSLSLELLRKTFEHLSASKRILLLDACRNSPDAGRADAANCMGDVISRDIVAAAQVRQWSASTPGLPIPQEPWYEKFGDPVMLALAEPRHPPARRSTKGLAGLILGGETKSPEATIPTHPTQLGYVCPGCGTASAANTGSLCVACNAFVHHECQRQESGMWLWSEWTRHCPICGGVVNKGTREWTQPEYGGR